MKILRFLFLLLLVSSCNTPRAVYDYDPQVNFESYSTYSLYPEFHSGLSQLDERRLFASLENELQRKGFSAAEMPDMYVNVYTEEYQEKNRNNVGIGIGGGGGNLGVGVSGGIPLGGPKTFLKLTFDFIDVQDDSLIWQAVVQNKFDPNANPEERQERFEKIVKKALEGYPPKK
jgi:hypothetical protein